MSSDSYQPYVEDYDSQVSEVVPLTRRQPRGKSGLSNEMSSSYDGVSDSGYSSTNAGTPNETPPLKSTTPAPINTPSPRAQKDAFKRASTPGIQRPSSKAYNRTSSPAVPRNIPGANPRERSPTMPSTGGADECDCADCKKDTASKGSPPSPYGSYHGSYHGSYGQSPSWAGFHYPTESPREEKKRSSMPPPPRPSSTFSGTISSSYSAGYGGYFEHTRSPAPAPPTPSSTCPPTAFSAYPPPPVNTANHSPGPCAFSPYGPPPSLPSYGGHYDAYPVTPSSSYPDTYSSMPPPPLLSGSGSTTKRRNSIRGQAGTGYYDLDDCTAQLPQRRSSRTGDRPPTWASASYRDLDGLDRSMSVPPGASIPAEAIRRKTTTPGPAPRRRESGHSQGMSGTMRLGPSGLCRAMESCAIDDAPVRSHSRSHSDYYSHGHSIARRDPGSVMHSADYSHSPSRSSGAYPDDLVQMTMPDMDGETFTMRYPAGIPVKIALGHKKKDSIENNVAYRCVQQRQQQVHAQLQYAALEHGGRKSAAGEYTHRSSRRTTMSGA
jgi:hypothetical protein